jgi:hypothetical protein
MRRERGAFAAAGDYLSQFTAPEAPLQVSARVFEIIDEEIEARDDARTVSFPDLKRSL